MPQLALIDVERYADIRALIDLSVDEVALPDETIELPVYGGAAEIWALTSAGDVSGWPAEASERLALAVCHRVAGMLLPALPNLTQEQRGERASYTRLAINVERRQAELYMLAGEHLAAAIELAGEPPVETPVSAPVFTLARGRSRWG